MNPLFKTDFYKVGHVVQYPPGTKQVWSNWTCRKSRMEGVTDVTFFGLGYALSQIDDDFQNNFFKKPWAYIKNQYDYVIGKTLNKAEVKLDHILYLYKLGYLPIKVYALPEGSQVPIGVPSFVITNTDPECFWLPNYLETVLSNKLWKCIQSATTAREYRKIGEKYARLAGETDLGFVDYQFHDFSYRGMSGEEDAIMSGMGHLVYFKGTDTIPALIEAQNTYGLRLEAASVDATEHSVMCAGSKDGEYETFKRLLTEVYPTGILSVVSDTWDLWKVLTDYVPMLRDEILARDGKIVIRPDSGDPVLILCGNRDCYGPARNGAIKQLAQALGTVPGGGKLPMINKGGVIYGDSITPDRADRILRKTIEELGLSPFNVVLGVGSYTYEYVTRDTLGQALKTTAVRQMSGEVVPVFKDPVTDDGMKRSAKGIVCVYEDETSTDDRPLYFAADMRQEKDLDNCAFKVKYEDGAFKNYENFEGIRERARRSL